MNKLSALAALTMLAGCSTTPNYDARFGDAVRQARLAMTINPTAASNTDQVTGIDGAAAREAIQRYHDGFKAPPPVMNVINIGAKAGGAKRIWPEIGRSRQEGSLAPIFCLAVARNMRG